VAACTQALVREPASPLFRELLDLAIEQRAAQKALLSDNPVFSRSYAEVYPGGSFIEDVRLHLASIDGAEVEPAAPLPAPQAPAEEVVVAVPLPDPVRVDPAIDEVALARELQVELNRVGCDLGAPDGIWGRKSERALQLFSDRQGVTLASLDPSEALLDLVKATKSRVCPLVCSATQVEKNGACVAKTCPKGQRLSSKGECFTPKVAQPASNGGGGGGGGGAKCFEFNGQQFCE
jgi:hypothetical protein